MFRPFADCRRVSRRPAAPDPGWRGVAIPLLHRAATPDRGRLALASRNHCAEGAGTAEDMDVKMIHLLMSYPPGIDNRPEPVIEALFTGQLRCHGQHPAEERLLAEITLGE